jgi:hypothetical protein
VVRVLAACKHECSGRCGPECSAAYACEAACCALARLAQCCEAGAAACLAACARPALTGALAEMGPHRRQQAVHACSALAATASEHASAGHGHGSGPAILAALRAHGLDGALVGAACSALLHLDLRCSGCCAALKKAGAGKVLESAATRHAGTPAGEQAKAALRSLRE